MLLQFLHGKRILMLLLAIAFLLQACNKTGAGPEDTRYSDDSNGAMAHQETGQTQAREAILMKGNEWIHGIPCFKDNSFAALTGEYCFRVHEAAGTGEEQRFLVYLCPDSLYFSEEWQPRRGTGNIETFLYNTEECFYIAAMLDDGTGVSWTAVFRFPSDMEESILTGDTFNQMLRVWSNKFFYFLYLAKSPGELSIPAVVEF